MKKTLLSGMFLFLAMTAMVSCTQENVMLETTPQVKNQEVRFSFFESSIVPIGQDEESNLARTRADGSEKSLKDAKLRKTGMTNSETSACWCRQENTRSLP